MYTEIPPITVPLAATGITLAGGLLWSSWLFLFCAAFALIGVVMAFRRVLPVPEFVRGVRNSRRDLRLKQALIARGLRRR